MDPGPCCGSVCAPVPPDTARPAPPVEMDQLFSLVYEDLRRIAGAIRRRDPSATLNPTALVNEAWLKLSASPPAGVESPLHFKRIAARAMRQVLVEAARRRLSAKRGAGAALVTFDEALGHATAWSGDLVGLDDALEDLARLSPRQAQMIEYRFFGGLDVAETAAMLNVSEATILRDWRAARAWLSARLARG